MTNDLAAQRELLYSLLGDLPDSHRPIGATLVSEQECDGYVLETLVLDLNGVEPVPAYFARPLGEVRQAPVILYHHAHG
ncbi:MAG: alpha/beta hydrolase, partial [Chloroflexi bacterium]|nr:alpha/beta hydrolase [Chloroflexota bacterium]